MEIHVIDLLLDPAMILANDYPPSEILDFFEVSMLSNALILHDFFNTPLALDEYNVATMLIQDSDMLSQAGTVVCGSGDTD